MEGQKLIYPVIYVFLSILLGILALYIEFTDSDSNMINHIIGWTLVFITLIMCPTLYYKIDSEAISFFMFFKFQKKIMYTTIYEVEHYMFGFYIFSSTIQTFFVVLPFERKKIFLIIDAILAKNNKCEIKGIKRYKNSEI